MSLPHNLYDAVFIGVEVEAPFPPGNDIRVFPLPLKGPGDDGVSVPGRGIPGHFVLAEPDCLVVIGFRLGHTVPGLQVPAEKVIPHRA
jgi:hypothetical protein